MIFLTCYNNSWFAWQLEDESDQLEWENIQLFGALTFQDHNICYINYSVSNRTTSTIEEEGAGHIDGLHNRNVGFLVSF